MGRPPSALASPPPSPFLSKEAQPIADPEVLPPPRVTGDKGFCVRRGRSKGEKRKESVGEGG